MALLSLRALAAARQSLLRGRREPEPEPLRLRGATSQARLRDAIVQHLPVQFYYRPVSEPGSPGVRYGVPYALFFKDGRLWLHAFLQPRSVSYTRGLPDWRTFAVSGISAVRLPGGSDDSLILAGARPAIGYNPKWYGRNSRVVVIRQRQPIRRS